ncbi:MAG: hypothetical protein WC566_03250 [Dehalococcoidia bacterium]
MAIDDEDMRMRQAVKDRANNICECKSAKHDHSNRGCIRHITHYWYFGPADLGVVYNERLWKGLCKPCYDQAYRAGF